MRLLASPDGRLGSTVIGQDVMLWHGSIAVNALLGVAIHPKRKGWMQLAEGKLEVQCVTQDAFICNQGDGVAVSGESEFKIKALEASSLLWFDLP